MNPARCHPRFCPFQELARAAVLIGALSGAPVYAQEVPIVSPGSIMLFSGPGAGRTLPAGTTFDSPGPNCSSNHYHGPLPPPSGPTAPGPNCGWGTVGSFSGGSMINLNQPGGELIFDKRFSDRWSFAANLSLNNWTDGGSIQPGGLLIDGGRGSEPMEFGGELGGPIVKDRLWFFGSGNRNRPPAFEIDQGARRVTIVAEGRADFTSPRDGDVGAFFPPPDAAPTPDGGKPVAGAPFTFTTYVLIDVAGGSPLALGVPIDVGVDILRPEVQPPADEDPRSKAEREMKEEVRRMSRENRQKALNEPLASDELKQAIHLQNAIDEFKSINETDRGVGLLDQRLRM